MNIPNREELLKLLRTPKALIAGAVALVLIGAGAYLLWPSTQSQTTAPVVAVKVVTMVDALRFRGAMLTDPAAAIEKFASVDGKPALEGFSQRMRDAGINTGAGWRYLLGTSVFTVSEPSAAGTLIVFYNPWTDSALFTVWRKSNFGDGVRIADAAWVPGDLVRQEKPDLNPQPLWLRDRGYRPEALAQSVIASVKAIETRFRSAEGWREILGIADQKTFDTLVTPILALTLSETLLRIKTVAIATAGEDPDLPPLRAAVAAFIRTATTAGFSAPLGEASDTTDLMRQAFAKLNPKTMRELAPVAFVAGEGNVTVFFASTASADYTMSVRFVKEGGRYRPAQLEFIPYAATYQAAATQR